MALHLITGSAGAGKSYMVYQMVIAKSGRNPGRDYLILVPEQFTMQTQKEVVDLHPGHAVRNIDILSFQRLAYRVFDEVGGNLNPLLDDTGKSFVLQKIAQQQKKRLGCLGANLKKPGYINEMKSMISELMQYQISPEGIDTLMECAGEQSLLYRKLSDVKIIYREFSDYMKSRYVTPEEVLDVLCRVIKSADSLNGSTVVLDGFTGFTPVQYQVIRRLLVMCRDVYVTVTLDDKSLPISQKQTQQLFYMSHDMMRRLSRLALEEHVEIADTRHLDGRKEGRFAGAPGLSFLESHLFRQPAAGYHKKPEEIHIRAAANPLEEMEWTVRRIRKLIRTGSLRYRDIAVITGDLGGYESYAVQAFEREHIPCFIDRKQSVLMNPFVEYVRAALDMLITGFRYEGVFRYLRTGMSDVTPDEIDILENYVIALGIRGFKQWSAPWKRIYRGMQEEELAEVERIRVKFVEEIRDFAEEFKRPEGTVASRTTALYHFIVKSGIQQKLKVRELAFQKQGKQALAREYAQIFGIIMGMLDKLVDVLGEEKVTRLEYQQILEAGFQQVQVGIIPPTADQVMVGDVKRTRLASVKVLFFVGVNEGVIPQRSESCGILTEAERELLKAHDIELAPTMREDIGIQRFYLYLILSKPSRDLYLSYTHMKADGQSASPAYLIGTIRKMFPKLEVEEGSRGEAEYLSLETPAQGMDAVVQGLQEAVQGREDAGWDELFGWYWSSGEYHEWTRSLVEAAFYERPEDRIGRAAALALYGRELKNSATRLETFAACAYAHFLQYGLRLSERARFEFKAMDMGNVLHEALERFARMLKQEGLSWKGLSGEDTKRLLDASVEGLFEEYGNTILKSSARNHYMMRRCRRLLERSIWALQEQLKRGDFEPSRFEVSFAMQEELDAAQFQLDEETRIKLQGRIDRVDTYESEDDCYVKVIDYKTGNRTLDLTELYHGLSLQLVVYLNAAMELEKKERPDKQVHPAGIFYYRIRDPLITGEWQESKTLIEQDMLKELRMNGLANADPEVLKKLDHTLDGTGTKTSSVFPLSLNKDGSCSKASSVIREEQFEVLASFVNDKIKELGRRIMEGEAEVNPYQIGQKNACEYCAYRTACGFDERIRGYEYRRLPQFSDDELWKMIKQEDV
ncbi:helicase-exonuclease AddAB subunit AddB [Ruminococcus gauvreauii]|uniref:Helicase-exonuclease AddAB subunit AddB n=1 Tax=Ruminococcus gauvreauii TaxID=438033 RepID=A0ABY5VIA0_9FIRM|nr:helicase-exonuclease AddAB subunit AddB [Ruminococcus gauvreauii]UWP60309.1 helicase-exonuclease AddAB subunit AddB [Ruminococcus gauvreauii]